MPGRIRWQYQIVDIGTFFASARLKDALGELGADGWELVGVFDKASNGGEKGYVLFKRPVGPDDPEPEEWAFLGSAAGTLPGFKGQGRDRNWASGGDERGWY